MMVVDRRSCPGVPDYQGRSTLVPARLTGGVFSPCLVMICFVARIPGESLFKITMPRLLPIDLYGNPRFDGLYSSELRYILRQTTALTVWPIIRGLRMRISVSARSDLS